MLAKELPWFVSITPTVSHDLPTQNVSFPLSSMCHLPRMPVNRQRPIDVPVKNKKKDNFVLLNAWDCYKYGNIYIAVFWEKFLLVIEGSCGSATTWHVTLFQPYVNLDGIIHCLYSVQHPCLGCPDEKFPMSCSDMFHHGGDASLWRLSDRFREKSLMSSFQVWSPEKREPGTGACCFVNVYFVFIIHSTTTYLTVCQTLCQVSKTDKNYLS